MVRKILPEFENPIDDVIIKIADNTDKIYKNLNMNPNHITTLSLIFGMLTAYYLYCGYNTLAATTYFISYYYDCMDGNYARKYNMVTKFGDQYDHISDMFKSCMILFAMYKKNSTKAKYSFAILFIFFMLSCVHLGCQEKVSDDPMSTVLDNFQILCPNEGLINYTRWFGCGTFNLVMLIMIYTY